MLPWSTGYSSRYNYYFLLRPAGFFISSVLVKYLAPEAKGHGTEKVTGAVHRRSGKIVNPSQVLTMSKPPSLEVEQGCEIVDAKPVFALREKSLIAFFHFFYYRVWLPLCHIGGRKSQEKR